MLQQTRVEAVVEPYRRFLAGFPTMATLAAASPADVLAAWSGLGYYRRARSLHEGARYVVRHHGGRLPRTRDELEKVPGIGPYTAGALLSIAFGQNEPAVDANVARVVARLRAIADPRSAAGREQVAHFAAALVAGDRPGDVNEALMDLGSAVCTAKEARCGLCPLARLCRGRSGGNATGIAAPKARKAPRRVQLACAVVRRGDRVLFLRRAADEALLGGMWELPTIETSGDDDAGPRLAELVRRRSGLRVSLQAVGGDVRHEIVGRRIVARAWCAEASRAGRMPRDARMLAAAEAREVALPALPVKILRALHRLGQPRWS